jgi:hypothetical protein
MLNNRKIFICSKFNVFTDTIKLIQSDKEYDLFEIENDKYIKFYKNCFNYKLKSSFKFFNPKIFKDIYFNNIFSHSNILKYTTLYDDNLGLYTYSDYVDGNLSDNVIKNKLNSKMFYNILDDMTNALIHIHSHGLLYLNFTFKNVLYKNNKFILHNFQNIEIVNDKYSNSENTILTDVFHLGALLLSLILQVNNINIPIKDITLKHVLIHKYTIISSLDKDCFNIIYKMLLPEKSRIYLLDIQNIRNNYLTKRYNKNRKKINYNIYDEMCHSYFKEKQHLYEKINKNNDFEFLNNEDLVYFTFVDIFIKKFDTDKKTAMFLSQILLKRNKIDIDKWAINYGIPIQFINNCSLNILLSNMKINVHHILCNECIFVNKTYTEYDKNKNKKKIITDNNIITFESNLINVINKHHNKDFSPKFSLLKNIINIIKN